MTTFRVLGGAWRADADRVALLRLLYCAMVIDPAEMDRVLTFSSSVSKQPTVPGKRVWTRVQSPSGKWRFISVDPAEYRETEPSGPDDLVLDLPPDPAPFRPSEMIRDVIGNTHFLRNEENETLRAQAERVLSFAAAPTYVEAESRFQEQHAWVRENAAERQRDAVHLLYDKCLLNFLLPLEQFVQALLLFQQQASLGQWFESCEYTKPTTYLFEHTRHCTETVPADMRPVLGDAGNFEFRKAKELISAALDGHSGTVASRKVFLAAASFKTALYISTLSTKYNLGADLRFNPIVAEEGFACAFEGLVSGIALFLENPEFFVAKIRDRIDAGGPDAIVAIESEWASPLHPSIPRRFARALTAAALACRPGPSVETGIGLLKELDAEYATGGEVMEVFERSWLDHELLRGYKRSGNAPMVERMAVRIAAAVLLERGPA